METRRALRRRAAALATVVVLGTLASCSGGGAGGGASASAGGDTLRLGYPIPPTKFDPATTSTGDRIWQRLIYDPLISLDPQTLEPVDGGLAKSWSYTNDLTFNIKLRDGVKFQDGTPLNADAVKSSISRFQEVTGLTFLKLPTLSSIEVVGPLELNLKLSTIDNQLPARLNAEAGMIVSPKATAASYRDITANPIGTGPYKLSEFVPGTSVTLVSNDDYWGDKRGYKTMKFTIFANTVSMVQAFQAGQLDFMTRVPFVDQKTLQADDRFNVDVDPTLWYGGIRLSSLDPKSPVHDIRVRKAIDMALDRDAITQLATEGFGKPTNQEFPPGYKFHSDTVQAMNPHNVDAAKKLVADVYPDGVKMNCVTYTGSYFTPAIPEIINEVKAIGIDMTIQEVTLSEALDGVAKGRYPCYFTQFGAQTPPDSLLGSNLSATSPNGLQTDPVQQIDQSLLADVTAAPPDKAKAAVEAVMVASRKTVITIPIFTRPESVTMVKGVGGYKPNVFAWDLRSLRPAG